ncbi:MULTISPECIES: S41 family peptidase [Streptacidiphilus]|uniref:S41 family peptidase n=1 Tax=Streptacidiphilus cavernicola TaxID=3342716 RepID=A0ABV6UVK2_9ACTN|nr:S41 family peptidase [Streptacidiphilus jeojiense]
MPQLTCARTVTAALALLIAGAFLPAANASAGTGAPPAASGVWQVDGYGTDVVIGAGLLQEYQTTTVSCLPGVSARPTGRPAAGSTVWTDDEGQVYRFRPGSAPDRAVLHLDGSAGDLRLRRIGALPSGCGAAAAADPVRVFDVFWATFAENYPFFAAKGVDWQSVRAHYRPLVHAGMGDAALFAVLRDMVAPLHDAHVSLDAGRVGRFAAGRPGTVPPGPELDQQVKDYIRRTDLGGLPFHEYARGRISWADLPNGQGYLRISGFGGYTPDPDDPYAGNSAVLESTLDTVLTPARTRRLHGLIIDLRVNGGGSDALGLQIAARLTDRPYLAYAKRARNQPQDPTRFTTPQPIEVRPADSVTHYTGPVAVLTGGSTVSAGETFTQALMGRPGGALRIGQPTQGVFSDVLDRQLPNGWSFGLPNEEFLTAAGTTFDGRGIPPQLTEPVFTPAEFAQGRDSAFAAAEAALSGL